MSSFVKIEGKMKLSMPYEDLNNQLNRMVLNRSKQAYAKRDRIKRELTDLNLLIKHQMEIKANVLNALGGLPNESDSTQAQVIAVENFEGYHRENIIFKSLPEVYVTANLYKPKFMDAERYPCILLACGHQKLGKHSEEYQFVAQTLVSYGFIVFVIDNFGQGERFSYRKEDVQIIEPLTYEHDHAGYQASLIGHNIARYMVHDLRRAMDYLITRSDVDATRIGMTGNSGGGTLTSLMMILDDRIQAAAPATFITRRDIYQMTGQAQDREQHWFDLAELGFDHEDILLAFAPKPLRLLIADHDFFPVEGTMKSYALAKRGYALYESMDQLSYTRFPVEHSYPIEMAKDAALFFQSVFKQEGLYPVRYHFDEHCLCTIKGQVRSTYPNARFIYDLNLYQHDALKKKRNDDTQTQLIQYLNNIVYRHRHFDAFRSRFLGALDETKAYRLEHWAYQSQVDMSSSILWFRNKERSTHQVLAVWTGGSSKLSQHEEFVHECLNNQMDVFILDLSGEGYLRQSDLIEWAKSDETYGSLYKLNDDLFWLGDALAALRTYELIQAIEWIQTQENKVLEVHGFGKHSVYVKIASCLSHHPWTYHEHDGFKGYEDWMKQWTYVESDGWNYLFPGILCYGDLSDL
jgi:hypothetical protein